MVSEKQLKANRKNAKKGGVKTKEGKEIVKYNAVKHGLLAQKVVIEGESQEEFQAFRNHLLETLLPCSALENLLADRIAASFWRLRRAGRIEVDIIDSLAKFYRPKVEVLSEEEIQQKNDMIYQRYLELIESGQGLPAEVGIDIPQEKPMSKEEYFASLRSPAAMSPPPEPDSELTLGEVVSKDFASSNTLSKYRRYEAHIERGLYRALHELQRIQAARKGLQTNVPVAIDIDVSGAGN